MWTSGKGHTWKYHQPESCRQEGLRDLNASGVQSLILLIQFSFIYFCCLLFLPTKGIVYFIVYPLFYSLDMLLFCFSVVYSCCALYNNNIEGMSKQKAVSLYTDVEFYPLYCSMARVAMELSLVLLLWFLNILIFTIEFVQALRTLLERSKD